MLLGGAAGGDEQAATVGDRVPLVVGGGSAGPDDAVGAGHHPVAGAGRRDGDEQAIAVGDR